MRIVITIIIAAVLGWLAGPHVGERAMARILERQEVTDGWQVFTGIGRYDGNWILRSIIARVGLGALVPEEALYYRTSVDAAGNPLDGNQVYVLDFAGNDAGWPPAGAFWSVTPYHTDTLLLVDNPIDLYQVGDRVPAHQCFDGAEASILITGLQGYADVRNGQVWLPAPQGPFDVVLRGYEPSAEMIAGDWMPPELVMIENPELQSFEADGLNRLPGMCQLGGVQ